ncbi:MAG: SPOR domain-containing protein [Acidobacteria bacterium]|nr:SPOR domain-containing protein [Acidobacteriota bacterium]
MKFTHRAIFSLIFVLSLVGWAGAQGVKYTVQLEAAPTREAAEEKIRQLKTKDVEAYIVKSFVPGKGTFYRVRVGLFPNQNEARRFGADLQRRGVVPEFFIATYEKPTEEVAAKTPPVTPAPAPAPKVQPVKSPPPVTPPAPETPANSQVSANNVATSPGNPATSPVDTPEPKAEPTGVTVTTTPASAPALSPSGGFARFQDPKIGYSFEYPSYWKGQPLNAKEASDQRMNGGALFQSSEDAAFLNAIWNDLDKANNPSNDNDLIVEVILKSMQSGEGTQLQETARKVQTENGLIKTYIDLKANFQAQGQAAPLDFLGKAVIVRAAKGILLVVAFYSKDAPTNTAGIADKIIASVRAPE